MTTLLQDNRLRIDLLADLAAIPPCFEPGQRLLWNDAHIAGQMLAAHLDPNTEAASRKPATIDQTVKWIAAQTGLHDGDSLLDLGCGPGLYCRLFAQRGLQVTGVDISENSLRYARQHDSRSSYIHMDYRELTFENTFDAAVLIYGDLCPLIPPDRDLVLGHIHRALKPGGWFVCDVTTPAHHARRLLDGDVQWHVFPHGGFFRPGPHLLLERYTDYADQQTGLDQHFVIEPDGQVTEFRLWTSYYTAERISAVLNTQGFRVVGLYNDLTGTPLSTDSEWIGVVAQRN
jgi:SAM-dependent methyltransferase